MSSATKETPTSSRQDTVLYLHKSKVQKKYAEYPVKPAGLKNRRSSTSSTRPQLEEAVLNGLFP
jgi:phage-related protein